VGAGTVNAGADTIKAGPGGDPINEAGDDAVDTIDCGSGTDTVVADANDRVAILRRILLRRRDFRKLLY